MLPTFIAVVLISSLQDLYGTFFKTRYSILEKNYKIYVDGVNTRWPIQHDHSNNKLLFMATLPDISNPFLEILLPIKMFAF